jgi:hypothetical protein
MTKAGMIFSSAAIAVLIGAIAVTVANGTFTALLSSIVTRPSVVRTQTPVISAAPLQQPEVKQSGAIEPVPAPAPPARVSNDSTSGAKTLDRTGSVPSAQAGGRVTPEDVLVPDAEQKRTALTAEEKAAVARGLKELEITPADATPSAPAEQVATAELNRKVLADSAAEVKQQQSQYDEQKSLWEKQQQDYLAQVKSGGGNP